MKESEREDARHWLEAFIPLYERNESAINEIASLNNESPPQDWDKAFSNENVSALMATIEPTKKLPKPKHKELRKVKRDYTDLVKTCLHVGHLYLKSYYAGGLSRLTFAKMIYWTTLAHNLFEDFLKRLQKVRQEIDINKEVIQDDYNTFVKKAQSLENNGEYQLAMEYYDKAIEIDTSLGFAEYGKGQCLENMGAYEEAISYYDRVLHINYLADLALVGKSACKEALGEYEEALSCADKALKLNPKVTYAWCHKAFALAKLEEYEEAIKCLDKALKIRPDSGETWYNKGLYLAKSGKTKEAIKCCDKALKIEPNRYDAWNLKGTSKAIQRKWQDALNCFDKALEINASDCEIWYHKGIILKHLQRREEATNCFKKFTELSPSKEDEKFREAEAYIKSDTSDLEIE